MPLSSSSGVQASLAPCPGNHCVVWFRIPPLSHLQVFSARRLTLLISSQFGRGVVGLGDGIVQVHIESREGIARKDKSRLGASLGAA